jgi:hypothetical protein
MSRIVAKLPAANPFREAFMCYLHEVIVPTIGTDKPVLTVL